MKSILDEKIASAQVARLAVLRGFPADPAARAEVMLVLRDWCVGERLDSHTVRQNADGQCKAVIDNAVRTLDGWRGPVQLKEIYDDLFPPRPLWKQGKPLE